MNLIISPGHREPEFESDEENGSGQRQQLPSFLKMLNCQAVDKLLMERLRIYDHSKHQLNEKNTYYFDAGRGTTV